MTWNRVSEAVRTADSIAFDGCHKIYVLRDVVQTEQMRGYGYGEDGSQLQPVTDPEAALATLRDWWEDSCGLRFVSAVSTVEGNANDGFESLIAQFEDES